MNRKVSKSGTTKYILTQNKVLPKATSKVSANFITNTINNVTGAVQRLWRVEAEDRSLLNLGLRGLLSSAPLNATLTNMTSNVTHFMSSQACIYGSIATPQGKRYISGHLELSALNDNVTAAEALPVNDALSSDCFIPVVNQPSSFSFSDEAKIGMGVAFTAITLVCLCGIYANKRRAQDSADIIPITLQDDLQENLLAENPQRVVEMARP